MSETAVAIQVLPRASRDAVVGERQGAIAIRLQAPPVEGAANAALRRFLADRLGVSPSAVSLVRGARSRHKRIAVRGWSAAAVRAALLSGPNESAEAAPELLPAEIVPGGLARGSSGRARQSLSWKDHSDPG